MKVEILNQYTQVWEVDGHETVDIYRTHKTLEQLKDDLNIKGAVTDGEWTYDGIVSVVDSILADAMGNVARAKEFNEKKHNADFGVRGKHTLAEIEKSDLVWVKGYGIVDDFETFKNEFEAVTQKK